MTSGLNGLEGAIVDSLRRAREVYLDLAKRGIHASRKGRGAFGDVSLLADLMCEEAIMKTLGDRLGDVAYISEERGIVGRVDDSDYVALIDPLDGSTNMSRGIGFFSAGIAISSSPSYNDVSAAGIIDMSSGEVFVANEDGLSIPNYPKLTDTSSLSEAVMSVDPRALIRGGVYGQRFAKLTSRLRHFRFLGSALLEQVYVVLGKLDGVACLSPELRVMDFVPGIYILSKAGGTVMTDFNLEELRLDCTERFGFILCSNERLAEHVRSIMVMDGST